MKDYFRSMSFTLSFSRLLRPAFTLRAAHRPASAAAVRSPHRDPDPVRRDPYYEMYLSSDASLVHRLHG